jgi:hypothetical protein
MLGGVVWALGVRGAPLVPPQVDGSNHGFFVARVLHTHSIDPSKVVVSDASGDFSSASFYPLAVHASAAVVVDAFHADVGQVLLLFDMLFASVMLPLGMYVLARSFAPREPLIAGFTALAVPFLALFPFASIAYGDVPLVVGMALVPITVVVLASVLTTGRDIGRRLRIENVIAGTLVLFTAVTVHTSQVPLIVVLVVLVVLERLWRAGNVALLAAVRNGLLVGGLVVVLFAPRLGDLTGGVSERSSISLVTQLSFDGALTRIVSLRPAQGDARQVLFAVLALAGAVIWIIRRHFAWLIGGIGVLAVTLFVWTSNNALARALGLPWYRSPVRIGFNLALFVPFFAGVALGTFVHWLTRSRRLDRRSAIAVTLGTLVVFTGAVGVPGLREGRRLLRSSFEHDALVTANARAAFRYLDRNAGPSDVVIDDLSVDGSLWMYAERGLRPLVAIKPLSSSGKAIEDWNERVFLLTHLDQVGRGTRADDLVRRYRVRWIYFNERRFGFLHHSIKLPTLEQNPHLRERFHRGDVHVYEIVLP